MTETTWEREAMKKRFRLVKIEKATEIRDGLFHVIANAWWPVTPDDEILFFRQANAPQCNQNRKVAESLRDRMYPGLEVRQIPVVFVPINLRDYV